MTKTLLTIALAAASLPMAFAAPQASTPANKSNTNTANTQQKTKKHSKLSRHPKIRRNWPSFNGLSLPQQRLGRPTPITRRSTWTFP